MSNIIDKIQLSGVTYDIGGSGGGKAIEGGTNISVTTGETADIINCTLPISADSKGIYTTNNYPFEGSGYKGNNIVFGYNNKIYRSGSSTMSRFNLLFGENNDLGNGEYTGDLYSNFVGGGSNKVYGTVSYSAVLGYKNSLRNSFETALGQYNVSNTGSTTADKTIFSVGNGTADNARHNAFEIRKNGDIYLSSGGTDIKLQDHLGGGGGGGITSGEVQTMIDESISGKQDTLISGTNIKTINNESILGSGNITIQGGGGNPTVELTQAEYDALVTAGTVSADTYYIITDSQAGDLTNYYTKTETNTLLGGKADTATTYTKTEVDNAITAATSTKQDTLVSGTNIKTINNQSLLGSGNIDIQGGGGGKAVSGGTNISITTGETADTINCTLPISATTQYSDSHNLIFLLGNNTSNTNTIKNNQSYGNIIAGFGNTFGNNYDQAMHNIVFGNYNGLEGFYQGNHADKNFVVGDHNFFGSLSSRYAVTHTAVFGDYNQPKNHYEYVFGKYNVSNTGSTDADKTLFSVGNGTADDARHNAFEIRQNGDIYLSSGGTDILLQDHLGGGGGGSSYTAGRGIDITNDTISFSLPISAGTGTNALIFASDTYDLSNRASGNYSVSLNGGGYHATYAKGVCSVAEGMDTYAYQSGCHAEGHSTNAGNPSVYFSMYAHAEGDATYAYGQTSHSEGYGTTAATDSSHAEGRFTVTKNNAEHASGQYNNSVSASTTFGDSGNTLFSVGNGTSTSARHNAFEIRQNGDIYCSDGTNDVKLQDTITATAANTTALGGLSLVKLTQAEYDALATKDNSTLYVIVN